MDNTNLLFSSKSLKNINQKINFELKNIVFSLRANNSCFYRQKTVIKKSMNFQISGQKIFRDGHR